VFARIDSCTAMIGGYHSPFPASGRLAAPATGYAYQPGA
ncbi:MAG: hypothetical protein RL227_440, partial [Pseudomonadota bacterium]